MSRAMSHIKTAVKAEKSTIHLITSSSRPITNQLQAITISTMSSNKKNGTACASVALFIFLLLSQMSKPVAGKPMLLGSEEEKLSNFHSTDPDNYTHLNLERQLVKREPPGETHVSEALKPLLRLLRIQNMDGDETPVDFSDPRARMRFGKRSTADNFPSFMV